MDKALFSKQFSDHLDQLGGPEYREKVLAYVEHEDTLGSLNYQLNLWKEIGFQYAEVLHNFII